MALNTNSNFLVYHVFLLSLIFQASANSYGYETMVKSRGKDFIPRVFGVQGLVFCKSGSKISPVKGAVVRITCLGVDKDGYETAPFSILSRPTDSNGYFLMKISAVRLEEINGGRITKCEAFLNSSPIKSCQYPTDINRGSSGAPLSAYRAVGSDGMRLYTVGPFVYGANPHPLVIQ